MEKVRYEEMLPHEIVERRKSFPAAFIGLGGLEWHSEHLAVGNDALKADKLCELAAARSGGFAFPPLWCGEPRVAGFMEANYDPDGAIKAHMGFKEEKFSAAYFGKTGDEQVEFYQALLNHVLVQMNTLEMKAVCLLCGHYPIYDWAAPVVERFNATFGDTQAFAGIEFHYPPKSKHVGGDHAAKWETSYLWYLRPDCVDMSVYLGREMEELIGIMGDDPRQSASVEVGRRACDLIVEGMIRKAKELIQEAMYVVNHFKAATQQRRAADRLRRGYAWRVLPVFRSGRRGESCQSQRRLIQAVSLLRLINLSNGALGHRNVGPLALWQR